MKNTLILLLLALSIGAGAQSKKELRKAEREQDFTEVTNLMDKCCISFSADRAFPMGYPDVDLTTNTNFLRLDGNKAEASLPYFGRAYTSTPGERGGIHFKPSEISNKKVDINNKKLKYTLSFTVKTDNTKKYKFVLNVFSNKSASLMVESNDFQTISYQGNIDEYVPKTK